MRKPAREIKITPLLSSKIPWKSFREHCRLPITRFVGIKLQKISIVYRQWIWSPRINLCGKPLCCVTYYWSRTVKISYVANRIRVWIIVNNYIQLRPVIDGDGKSPLPFNSSSKKKKNTWPRNEWGRSVTKGYYIHYESILIWWLKFNFTHF